MRALLAALLALAGCVDDLGSPTEIEDNRVLAAVAEVTGMPGVAWPEPGEEITVTIVVVDEAAPRPIGYRLVACVESEARVGATECAGPPFLEATREVPATDDPRIVLVAPAGAPAVLVRGVVCAGSAPLGETGCADPDARSTRFRYSVRIAEPGGDRNRNPSLADVRLGGDPWPEADGAVPGAPCDGSTLPIVRAGAEPIVLDYAAADGALEPYLELDGTSAREELQVSHHATGGELDTAFAYIGAPDARGAVRWTPPPAGEVASEGEIVGFFFVARDRRGGTGVSERAACVLP